MSRRHMEAISLLLGFERLELKVRLMRDESTTHSLRFRTL
jgi:hypothetical protein